MLCEAFIALNSTRDFSGGFKAHVAADLVDTVNVCRLVTDEHIVLRSHQEISRMPRDCYFVNMQIEGDVHVRHLGKQVQIRPSQFYVVDSAEPYELIYRRPGGRVRTFSFRIPKALLAPQLASAHRTMGVAVTQDTAIGALAIDFLKSLALQSGSIPAAAHPTTARMAVDLVALALGPREPQFAPLQQSKRKAMLDSIVTYIDHNCAEAELSIDVVCRRFGLSPRTLHRLFESEGLTFSRLTTSRRLSKCAEAIRARPDTPISTIAFANGFNDLSSFNRQFRRHFDLTPSEYRDKAIVEQSDGGRK
ncbi:helix-turn-helix domain-containing protein [Rhodopseudomonas sp. B29]|uniref:helix-turn-helix domain-containing protein n=1 Tax=Rhodopseudomonas sp. B29 TaxID=95607 RepID=UPI00131F0F18|nr:helix-turn-helix domain-containing protein [Rhodopseudomonas sp. B29]